MKLFVHSFDIAGYIKDVCDFITTKFNFVIFTKNIKEADAIFAIGGDGTILSAKYLAIEYNLPIIGYNSGTLGFLATDNEIAPIFNAIFNETLITSSRDLLKFVVYNDDDTVDLEIDSKIKDIYAVNDIVISNNERGKLLNLNVFIHPTKEGVKYCADSLIISSPTGSTAYNLSAGGSIVHPYIKAMLMTPVAPFSMSSRPIIIPPTFRLTITSPDQMFIKIDGQGDYCINNYKKIKVFFYGKIDIIKLDDTFFKSIEQKLQWNHIIKQ